MLVQKKIITVSSKRQITIPQKFYNTLGFKTDAECVMRDGGIFITPLKTEVPNTDFSEEILKDLISQGFEGNELLRKFVEQKSKIRPAVEKMLLDADEVLKDESSKVSFDDLFGEDE